MVRSGVLRGSKHVLIPSVIKVERGWGVLREVMVLWSSRRNLDLQSVDVWLEHWMRCCQVSGEMEHRGHNGLDVNLCLC